MFIFVQNVILFGKLAINYNNILYMRKTLRKRIKKAGTKSTTKEIELATVSLSDNFKGMPVIKESYFSIDDDLVKLKLAQKKTLNALKDKHEALNNYSQKSNFHNNERRHFSNLQNYGMSATKEEIKELRDTAKEARQAEDHLSKANQELEKAIKEENKTFKAFYTGTVKRSSGGRRKNRKSIKRL